MHSEPDQKFTINELILPAIGYLLVAFICILSGNSLHKNELTFADFISLSPEQFFYWLLLIPVFINRVIMFEQRSHNNISNIDNHWKQLSVQLPVYLFIFCFFIFLYLNYGVTRPGQFFSTFSFSSLISVLVGLTPIYIQSFFNWRGWVKQKGQEHFNFRNYILFPALCTCIISFMVGWSDMKIEILFIPSLLIFFYFILSKNDNTSLYGWKITDWFFLFILSGGFFYEFIIEIPIATSFRPIDLNNGFIIILTCAMMTLIMIITETWWFVKDDENKTKYSPADLEFYEKRLNKVTAAFPMFIPVCIFYPFTNNFFYSILFYSLGLCLIWIYGQKIDYRKWRWIRFICGIILPVLIALSLRGTENVQSVITLTIPLQLTAYAAIIFVIIAFFRGGVNKPTVDLSTEKKWCLVTSIIFLVITSLLPFLINFFRRQQLDPFIIEKFNLLHVFYFIVILILGFEMIIKLFKTDGNSNNSGTGNGSLHSFIFFLFSGRPLTSLLSGICVFLLIHHQNILPLLLFAKSLPIILVTMLGFVVNDIYDLRKDKLAGKARAITTGKLSVKSAFFYCCIFVAFSLSLELIVNSFSSFIALLVILLFVLLYSPFSKNYPALKSFYTALLCCSPLAYGFLVGGLSVQWLKLLPVFLFVVGRELWLDQRDYKYDRLVQLKTAPYFISEKYYLLIAFLLMLTGSFVTIILYPKTPVSLFCMLTLCLCFIVAGRNEKLAIQLSIIPMLLGIIALTL